MNRRLHTVRRHHLLGDVPPPATVPVELTCAVSMWDYVVPAAIGGGAGLGVGFLVRYILKDEHPTTRDAAAHIVEGAVTMLVGGMTFILRLRRPRPMRPDAA